MTSNQRFAAITTVAIGTGVVAALLVASELKHGKDHVVYIHDVAPVSTPVPPAGLVPLIPQGFRAVSVRVNDVIGVAGFVLPGSHVDVIATAGEQKDVLSRVVLSDVTVLASGADHAVEHKHNDPVTASVVTLALEPADTERLAIVADRGRITLTLRNEGDHDTVQTTGAHLTSVMSDVHFVPKVVAKAKPVVVLPPAPVVEQPTVESIKGSKRSREVLK